MIGGNVKAEIQTFTSSENEIGESVKSWETTQELTGFIDLSGGDSRYTVFDAKVQESTHIFICDYTPLNPSVTAENSRMKINGRIYDIKLIDNPMELCEHLEIYLKLTGGQ